jgi:hypothetical protein
VPLNVPRQISHQANIYLCDRIKFEPAEEIVATGSGLEHFVYLSSLLKHENLRSQSREILWRAASIALYPSLL